MRCYSRLAIFALLVCAACTASPPPQQSAPTQADIAAHCAVQPCRQPGTVEIEFDGDTVTETIAAQEPYILNNTISIRPGESLVIESTVQDDRLVDLRVQTGAPTADPVLILEFEQNGSERLLTIKSSLDVSIKFHIDMRFPRDDEWHETTSCGLQPSPGAGTPFWTTIEHWLDPIAELRLSNFRVVSSAAAGNCVY